MTLKQRLESLTNITPLPQNVESAKSTGTPKTAPGKMLGLVEKNEQLAEQLRSLEQSSGQQQISLDPRRVRFSRFANRSPSAFASPEFKELKESIRQTGGNQIPVIVRPVEGQRDADYEIVYGHRRRQACLEVGCHLRAIVQPLSDRELYFLMATENFFREDLSPYEAGKSYLLALTEFEKDVATQVQLAEALGKTQAHVSQSIRVAQLPDEIVSAFPSPTDIQVRWATPLHAAMDRDAESVLARAREIVKEHSDISAPEVFRRLLPPKNARRKAMPVVVRGKSIGSIEVAKNGALAIRLTRGAVTATRLVDLQRVLAQFLQGE